MSPRRLMTTWLAGGVYLDTQALVLKHNRIKAQVDPPVINGLRALDDKVACVRHRVITHKPLSGVCSLSLFGGFAVLLVEV